MLDCCGIRGIKHMLEENNPLQGYQVLFFVVDRHIHIHTHTRTHSIKKSNAKKIAFFF